MTNQDIQSGIDQAKTTLAGIQAQAQPVINSTTLTPQPPINYATPAQVPIPSVTGLDSTTPALTATPTETQANDLSTSIEGLNNQLVGKSAYQTEQETAAGIPDLQKTQTDLSTQIKQLQNEALAIPQQLQLDSTGRGITAGGLAPIQTARLRTNAIAALGASSLLDATNGLLASAQSKADKAVAAKYDPIQEQIDAATKNLDLILKSPQYSLEQKNQAQAQLDQQKQKQDALDKQKQDSSDVLNAAIAAAKNGADASTLQAIQSAPDGTTALGIAAKAGYANSNVQDLMTKYPDAGIQPGDSLTTAQAKILNSPSYKANATSASLANALTQSEINKNRAALNSSGGGTTVPVDNGQGSTTNVPLSVAPYYSVSTDGTGYMDASSIQGTAAEKSSAIKDAQLAGIKVITNKDTAADLVNIGDANAKLDTIGTIMSGIDQPGVLSRALYGAGLTKLAEMTQSNPQQAAAGALQSVGLDILKAISGVQGFRGNATVVQQVNDHLPSIYDTADTVNTKIDFIRQLITDREDSILGTSKQKLDLSGFENGGTGNAGSTSNGVDLSKFMQ